MSQFQKTLNRLETRLQALVEGGISRLFPAGSRPADLTQKLISAMKAEIRPSPDGKLLAPNLFTVFMHAEDALLFQSQIELLEELAAHLKQACRETQVQLAAEPVIKVLPSPEPDEQEIQVIAQYSLVGEEKTSTLRPIDIAENLGGAVSAYLIVDGTHIFQIKDPVVNIGRHDKNDLVIPNGHVSRSHAQLRLIRGRYALFDLGSTSGTYVNGRKITQCILSPGDVISLGDVPIVFGLESQPGPDATTEFPSVSSDN